MKPTSHQLKHKILRELYDNNENKLVWNDKWNDIWLYFRKKTCNQIIIPVMDETNRGLNDAG